MSVIRKFNFSRKGIPSADALPCCRPFRVFKIEAGSGIGENWLAMGDINECSACIPGVERRRGVGVCNKR